MSKFCPYCSEEVKPAAKVCPHCRQWLSLFSLRNPTVALFSVSLLYAILTIALLTYVGRLMNPGMDFSPYRNSISVTESRMNFQFIESNQMIFVVGVLTNKGNLPWKDVHLDVRFYNRSGEMIDATSGEAYSVIYPGADLAFRTKCAPSHNISEYDSWKVFIGSAQDPKTRFY